MPAPKHLAFQQQIEQLTATFAADLVRVMKAAIVESVTSAVDGAPSAPVSVRVVGAPAPARPAKAARAIPSAPIARAPKAAAKKLPGKARRPKGAKRSRALIARTTAALLAEIVANPGQRIEQIAKAMKTATKELTLPTKKLLGQGKIKSAGVKRATTYSPA
jgi:hypothetical protein